MSSLDDGLVHVGCGKFVGRSLKASGLTGVVPLRRRPGRGYLTGPDDEVGALRPLRGDPLPLVRATFEAKAPVGLRGWRVNCAGTRCGESAGLPLIRTPSSLAGSIGTAGKHFSLPLVLYTQLLNADGELLVIVGHLGLATGDLSAPDGPAVGQRTRQPPEQESTVLR